MKKKIKIAIISNTSNFFKSFMLKHIKILSKSYELTIFCHTAHKLKSDVPRNVSLIDINFRRGISIFNDIIAFLLLIFFFLKNRPAISISFTPKIGFIVLLSAFLTRIPLRIHWFTGQIWCTKKGVVKKFYKFIDKLIFFLSTRVLVDGLSQKKFLIKEKVISEKKSTVLQKGSVGGVDLEKFKLDKKKRIIMRKKYSISQKTFVFLFLGRINKDKGVFDLVKAYEKLLSNQCKMDILLVFVGPIEDKNFFNIIKGNKKILYFDFTNNPENWLSMSDILCLPSYREGFGTVIIEAASCGVPSLCSRIYGLKDSIIDRKTGFFHKVGNINDIKKKMIYVIKNKKIVKGWGYLAKNRVEKEFNNTVLANKFLSYLKIDC